MPIFRSSFPLLYRMSFSPIVLPPPGESFTSFILTLSVSGGDGSCFFSLEEKRHLDLRFSLFLRQSPYADSAFFPWRLPPLKANFSARVMDPGSSFPPPEEKEFLFLTEFIFSLPPKDFLMRVTLSPRIHCFSKKKPFPGLQGLLKAGSRKTPSREHGKRFPEFFSR